jgi:YD repeat-containing protein
MTHIGGLLYEEEAAPQLYRKIALNGQFICDTEPYLHKRSDAEQEQTCIDGLTLDLRHQTTDVYVPLFKNDFALEVRRNHVSSVWLNETGLAANQRPDLPFGNCWSSGIAANVHVIDRGLNQAVNVFVTDEQGTLHRFVEFYKEGQHAGYYPLPGCASEQDSRALALIRRTDRLEFSRKYGTSLWFDFTKPALEISIDLTGPAKETHFYYRCLLYHFEPGNGGLIPDGISISKRRMAIHRNQQGLVEKIVDLRGYECRYEYRDSTVPGGAPLLVRVYRPHARGQPAIVSYEYDEVSHVIREGACEQHAVLSLITDDNRNTHRFHYLHHFTQLVSDEKAADTGTIRPIRLCEVQLPNNLGTAKFHDYSLPTVLAQPDPVRMTFVSDVERNGRLHEFTEKKLVTLDKLPYRRDGAPVTDPATAPRFHVWRKQQIRYYQGDRHVFDKKTGKFSPHFFTKLLLKERYKFELGAGLALARTIDTEGNVTSFAYQDQLIRNHLIGKLPDTFQDPFSQTCRDVTEARNPLGGIKRFAYHPANRAISRKEDELGHLTVFDLVESTGLPRSETVYADANAEKENVPFTRSEFEYGDVRFPGFLTKRIIRKTMGTGERPSWEVDLVRLYEADEYGNRATEIADPEGLNLAWHYQYDEHNGMVSMLYPNGYYIQYRYDPYNRVDRIYRDGGSVEKIYFDGVSNRTREVAPNGDTTTNSFDSLNRLIKKIVETGPIDQRQKAVSIFGYNALNSRIYEAIPGEPIKSYKYGALPRVIFFKNGRREPSTYSYSANGNSNLFASTRLRPCRMLVERRSRWYYLYDGMQNELKEACAPFRFGAFFSWNKRLLSQTFDVAGNLIQKKDQTGLTRYEYDALNRLLVEYHPSGKWTRTLRSSTGLEFGSLDSWGRRTEKRFDAIGEEISS